MNPLSGANDDARRKPLSADLRLALAAGITFILDQITKILVAHHLPLYREIPVFEGFFRIVHWGNTGAAWSLFHDRNGLLALVAMLALAALIAARRFFGIATPLGQAAFGMILGGISGNLLDRIRVDHVIDMLYFHLHRPGLSSFHPRFEAGFPAFNLADTGICVGVALLFLLSFQETPNEPQKPQAAEAKS